MSAADPVDFLADEVDAMLGAGRVGLYEFPQFLRLGFPDLQPAEERRICRQVLSRLLAADHANLVWARWAGPAEKDASGVTPPDSSWDGLSEDPDELYLAVEPA